HRTAVRLPVRRRGRRAAGEREEKSRTPEKTQKIIEIRRWMWYTHSKLSPWEGNENEACQDAERRDPEEERRPRRLRGVPDLLPVRLQDLLHRRQSEVREPVRTNRA